MVSTSWSRTNIPSMAARHISVREAQNTLSELVKMLSTTRQQVVVELPETRGVVLVSEEYLFALEETLELMSDAEHLDRIKAGEQALASGNFVSQGQFEQEMGVSIRTMPTRWRLFVSGPARRAILSLPIEMSRARVVEFLTDDLAERPGEVGVELEGQLSRRYVASVADQRVVYRLDPTNRAVRVVDVQRGERVFMAR